MLKQQSIAWLLAGAMMLAPAKLAGQETKSTETSPVTVGTGEKYQTTITREAKGELKPEDARQVSVLGSRILAHLHNGARFLAEPKPDQARTEHGPAQATAKPQ